MQKLNKLTHNWTNSLIGTFHEQFCCSTISWRPSTSAYSLFNMLLTKSMWSSVNHAVFAISIFLSLKYSCFSLFLQTIPGRQWLEHKMLDLIQDHCALLHWPLHLPLFTVNLLAELISRAACLIDTSLPLFTLTIPLQAARSPPLKAFLINPTEVATLYNLIFSPSVTLTISPGILCKSVEHLSILGTQKET